MDIFNVVGVVIGIVVFAVFKMVLQRSLRGGRKEKPQYDERQLLARGYAFMWAFWSLLCYVVLLGFAGKEMRIVQENVLEFIMIGVVFSAGVFGVYSVWNDAYVQVGLNPRRYMILTACIGALNVVSTALTALHSEAFHVSMIAYLMVGVLMFAMSFALFLKQRLERREEER